MSDNPTAKSYGRSLRLFLVDGSPTGIVTAELGNWSGKVVVAPRTLLPELVKHEETGQTGVYLLAGPDPDDPARALVYVGEGDSIKSRLAAHDADEGKQFFSRVCVIVSKDSNLTKAHVRYLEARIIALIKAAGRANLQNGTAPISRGLPPADIADMEGFLAEIAVILPVVGLDILRGGEDATVDPKPPAEEGPVFVFTQAGTNARAKEIDGEFVVLAGSITRAEVTDSTPNSAKVRRAQLLDDGSLIEASEKGKLRFSKNVA